MLLLLLFYTFALIDFVVSCRPGGLFVFFFTRLCLKPFIVRSFVSSFKVRSLCFSLGSPFEPEKLSQISHNNGSRKRLNKLASACRVCVCVRENLAPKASRALPLPPPRMIGFQFVVSDLSAGIWPSQGGRIGRSMPAMPTVKRQTGTTLREAAPA